MYTPHALRRANSQSVTLCILTALCLIVVLPQGHAQFGDRLLKAAQRGAERALERKAEQKTGDAVDNTVDEALKKPEKKGRDQNREDDDDRSALGEASSSGSTAGTASGQTGGSARQDDAEDGGEAAPAREAFSTTSKYDFETGPAITYFDDFDRTAVGDFPTGYNSSGTVEVNTVSSAPGKWIKLTGATGGLVLMELGALPDNFTLEYDLIADVDYKGYRYNTSITTIFTDTNDPERDLTSTSQTGDHALAFGIKRNVSAGWATNYRKQTGRDGTNGSSADLSARLSEDTRGTPHHVAFWRQGQRIRMYVDDEKVYDQQLGWTFDEPMAGIRLFVSAQARDTDGEDAFYVANFRLAEGNPDTRSKLETEGKLTTYGITFASGSSDVELSSAGTLKMIAKVMSDNPDMNLRITGHTDADGATDTNQALSEKRAAAVKTILVKDYQIKADRLTTAGAGESDPIATGDTPSDKARNRRVVLEKV